MVGIVSERRKPCQPKVCTQGNEFRMKIFLPPIVHLFELVV